EAFIPSVPIEMPSDTAMVLYSMGVPPAARIPAFTRSDKRRKWKLQGMTSIQVFATPMIGRDKSSSVNPTAFNIALAGARAGPTSISWLLSFHSFGMTSSFTRDSRGLREKRDWLEDSTVRVAPLAHVLQAIFRRGRPT